MAGEATSSARGIVFVGASYVERGSELARSAAEALAAPFEARGVRGATLERWLAGSAAVPLTGQHVIVGEFGGNGVPTSTQVTDAHAALVGRGAASVRWMAPPSGYPDAALNQKRVATLRAIEAAGVPLVRVSFSARGKTARDGQHLTGDGYREYGRAIAARILAGGGLDSADGATSSTRINGKALIAGAAGVGLWLLVR